MSKINCAIGIIIIPSVGVNQTGRFLLISETTSIIIFYAQKSINIFVGNQKGQEKFTFPY